MNGTETRLAPRLIRLRLRSRFRAAGFSWRVDDAAISSISTSATQEQSFTTALFLLGIRGKFGDIPGALFADVLARGDEFFGHE